MLLTEAIECYLLFKSTRAAKETIVTDRYIFKYFLKYITPELSNSITVRDIKPDHIRAYIEYDRDRGLSSYTLHRNYATLSAFWTWLCLPDIGLADMHVVKVVPVPKLPKKVVKTLSQDDIKKLVQASATMKTPRRARALILFLLDTGARVSEVAGVELSHLDLKSGRVLVTGKGSKQRHVFLGRRSLQAVWLYIKQERPEPAKYESDHLFLTRFGYPMNRDNLRKAINRIGDAAGFHVYPHLFRHTCAIERLRRGMDLMTIKTFLGHEKLATTEKYLTALNNEDIEHRARKTSPADDWRL